MQTLRQEYRQFLSSNFKGLRLRKPLFYSWDYGIRFDLQVGETNTNEYFEEVLRRASTIFHTIFDSSDKTILVFMDYKYRRRKIRFSNFVFKQIHNIRKTDVCYLKESKLYEPNDKLDVRNVAIVKKDISNINYQNILIAIGNIDFGNRHPRLDEYSVFTSKEVYFINTTKRLIFHMYDDRGLDIISADKESIRPIYEKYNDWVLDYDRERINQQFY